MTKQIKMSVREASWKAKKVQKDNDVFEVLPT